MVFLVHLLMVQYGLSHVTPPKTTLALFLVGKPGHHGLPVTVIVMFKTVPITGTLIQEIQVPHVPTQPISPKPKLVLLVSLKTVHYMVHFVILQPIVLMALLVHKMNVVWKPMAKNIVIG